MHRLSSWKQLSAHLFSYNETSLPLEPRSYRARARPRQQYLQHSKRLKTRDTLEISSLSREIYINRQTRARTCWVNSKSLSLGDVRSQTVTSPICNFAIPMVAAWPLAKYADLYDFPIKRIHARCCSFDATTIHCATSFLSISLSKLLVLATESHGVIWMQGARERIFKHRTSRM